MGTRSPWALEYARRPHEYVLGTAPSPFARMLCSMLVPGTRVLELGCGEGRDSVFFASCGCEVTAVDVSAAGLRKAERLSRSAGVAVHWVHGDAARLEQVMVNLLTNAAKYTDHGGHVWLTVQREDEEAVLRVRDTGVGIAPEKLETIFESFNQADTSTTRAWDSSPDPITRSRNVVDTSTPFGLARKNATQEHE